MISILQIKKAVLANRGGFENASNAEIMTIWRMLSPETQKQYLESIKEKKPDALSNKS